MESTWWRLSGRWWLLLLLGLLEQLRLPLFHGLRGRRSLPVGHRRSGSTRSRHRRGGRRLWLRLILAIFDLCDSVLIVGVVRIARAQEVELWIVHLVLLDALLKLQAIPEEKKIQKIILSTTELPCTLRVLIPGYKSRGLVHNVPHFRRRINNANGLRRRCSCRGFLQGHGRHILKDT